jgi:hypothetical protein
MGRKKLIVFIISVIVILFGFLVYENRNYIRELVFFFRKKPQENESVKIEPPPPTVENTEKALLKKAILVFPNITSSAIITIKQVPKSLLPFLKVLKNENFKMVYYENSKTGYLLDFEVDLPLTDVYQNYVSYLENLENETRWQILYRQRANLFAFIEAENENFKIRISQKYLNPDQTLIEIKVISK